MIGALLVCTLAALFSHVGTRCVHTNQTLGSKRPLDTTRGRCYYATVLVHRAKLRIYCAFLKLTYHVRVGRVGYNASALAMPSPPQCGSLEAADRVERCCRLPVARALRLPLPPLVPRDNWLVARRYGVEAQTYVRDVLTWSLQYPNVLIPFPDF